MNCPKCNGKGWNYKHRNCDCNHQDAYVKGCHDEVVCYYCLGTGSTGASIIKAALLEIKLESTDTKARRLAEKALKEFTE